MPPVCVDSDQSEAAHMAETELVLTGAAATLERFSRSFLQGDVDRKVYLSRVAMVARALRDRFPQHISFDHE